MRNSDMPAMPVSMETRQYEDSAGCTHVEAVEFYEGLTKREHFAGLAMQGLCHAIDSQGTWAHDSETVADAAVIYADALLAQLDKSK
jgi:hypothetical protein